MIRQSRPVVCIVGAGPYGVSIAAHLRALGVPFRIFGVPMNRWRSQMPEGMYLKSEGFASNLYDLGGEHTLAQYCAREGLPFGAYGTPVSREIFVSYALAFQQELVPNVEELMVVSVDRTSDGFELVLENGESIRTEHVILATGLDRMAASPPVLGELPAALWSHSAAHRDLSQFRGRDVTVIGGGQSALETAALLAEAGVAVRVVVREGKLAWNPDPQQERERNLYQRLRHPRTNLGDGLQPWFYTNAPGLYRWLPRTVRLERLKHVLGPAGGWWLKPRVLGQVPVACGVSVRAAEERGGRVLLHLSGADGRSQMLTTDHVIAATGYRFQVRLLPFLTRRIKTAVRHEQQLPILSPDYESSVPGLYFAGVSAGYSFGPSMRFLCGAAHPARRISSHIAAGLPRLAPAQRAAFGQVISRREFEVHE